MTRVMGRMCRFLVLGTALTGGLLLGPLHPLGAHAQWGNCLDDPIVFLSDGTVIDLSTVVYAPAASVQSIAYTLHVAPGLTVNRLIVTGGTLPYVETFTLVNDAAAGHVQSEMVASTASHVRVTTATLVSTGTIGWATGLSGQTLIVAL